MKKAFYLVDNYQNKHYEPEKFMKYRNKRQVELEKQFIKEYIKKNSKKGGGVNTEKVTSTMSETTTSKAAPGESKTRASMNEEES